MTDFEEIENFMFRCKTCGKVVPSGIANISGHWVECSGKDFTKGLKKKAELANGKLLTELDIAELQNLYLK